MRVESDGAWHGSDRATRDGARRRRLLDAALDLFGTVGYRATTVQQLCRRAGVSSRTFYELYPGREALFEELYDELNAEVIAGIASSRRGRGTQLADVVAQLVTGALSPMLRDERRCRVLEVEAVGVSDRLERRRRLTYRQLAATVEQAAAELVEAGMIERGLEGLAGIILVGGVTEALAQRLQEDPAARPGPSEFSEDVTQAVLRLLT